jgi:hypothetical protein
MFFDSSAICGQRVDIGPCYDGYKRWYFDTEQGACLPFVYGGCGGNLNRFTSFASCVKYCDASEEGQMSKAVIRARGVKDYLDNKVFARKKLYKALLHPARMRTNTHTQHTHHAEGILPWKILIYCIITDADNSLDPCAAENTRCVSLQCAYGVTRATNAQGCVTCECHDPCRGFNCAEGEACAVDFSGNYFGSVDFRPVCRRGNGIYTKF